MPNPINRERCAQHTCARNPQHDDGDELDEQIANTLAAELRAYYAAHTELVPCLLSTPELAALFVPHVYERKPAHAERQVQRAHALIRGTYGARFREQRRTYGRATLPFARWIDKPGGSGRSDPSVLTCEVDLRTGDLAQRADQDRARGPRRSATRSTRSREPRKKEAREVRGSPRRRAVPHGVVNPPELAPAPVAVDAEGLATVNARWPSWRDELALELRRQRYHQHPVESCRAVRTLAVRDTDTPLRYLRDLFKRARAGDLLVDKAADNELVEAAEAEARRVYAYDEHDPSTHWQGTAEEPPGPTPDELAAEQWRRTVRAREAELRKPAGVGWWQILATVARTARFLGNLRPETAASLALKSNATL